MYKIAFCLHGIVGSTHRSGKGDTINFADCAESYKNMIFRDNDVDVFIHSWSVKHGGRLTEIYKPKVSVFEPQIQFKVGRLDGEFARSRFAESSRWYSAKRVIELEREYSIKNNINYDFIMITRFDMLWFVPLKFEELEKDMVYLSNWNNYGTNFNTPITRGNNSWPHGTAMRLYQDLFIIGNQEQMDHVTRLYEDRVMNHTGNKHSPHVFLYGQLKKYRDTHQIRFKYDYMIDYNLWRRHVTKNWI